MQKLQLSIPEPCHENWQQMKPTEQGRYCNACAKEVIDFSMMTDTEVLNYFTHTSHDNVCGRALPSQLDRTITRPKEPKKRLFWYWNYIVMFLMFFSKSNNAKAQGNVQPVTALSPIKPADSFRGDVVVTSRVVTGKVSDEDGNPVSFATIKIKGTNTGLSADAKGDYSIRVNTGAVLTISAISFKEAEIPVGTNNVINSVMEKSGQRLGEMVFVAYNADFSKFTALIQVKEDGSGVPISDARILISKRYTDQADTVITNKKGFYKLKGIKKDEDYFIKVEADGYGINEFTISVEDFRDRKGKWEVLLVKKQVVVPVAERAKRKSCPGATVRLGGVSVISDGAGVISDRSDPLYVVDGCIEQDVEKLKMDDVDDMIILKSDEAVALYGNAAANGAFVITTRKSKTKNLKEVVIVSDYSSRAIKGAMGSVSYIRSTSIYNEVKARVNTLLTDSLKVYPNPVEPGTSFNVSLKLRQTGNHRIQISDAAGRIILQKQINVAAKEYKEIIHADAKWSGGVYYIRVFDNKTQLVSKSSFIVR